MTRYGTSYFADYARAVRYYREQGFKDAEKTVDEKLADGEIHLGRPLHLEATHRVWLDTSEGRYHAEEWPH